MGQRAWDAGTAGLPAVLAARVAEIADAVGAWGPSVAPNHSAVAFVCDRSGLPRLEVVSVESGHGRVLSLPEQEVISASWSPDGGWLVYLVSPGGSIRAELHAMRPDGSAHRLLVGGGERETAFLGAWTAQPGRYVCSVADGVGPDADVVAVDLETGMLEPVPAGTGRGFHTVCAVSADGHWILARRGPRNQRRLYLLPAGSGGQSDDGEPIRLLASDFPLEVDDTAEDGRFLDPATVYVRTRAGGDRTGLVCVDIAGGAPKPLTSIAFRPDADLESFGILDADRLLLSWNMDGISHLELVALEDGQSGRTAITLSLPGPVLGGWGMLPGRVVAEVAGPSRPRTLVEVPLDGSAARPLRGMPEQASPDYLGVPTAHAYTSLDGIPLQGWLYRGLDAPAPGPTVISFHGGPESQERSAFSILTQSLATAGINVFAPNVRGSTGYGARFTAADDGSARPDSFQDVQATVEYLIETGIAAPGLVGVNGWSYGGYLALIAVTRWPELFAAGVTHAGMSDLSLFFAETEPWMAAASVTEYGDPATQAELLRLLSPLTHLDAVRTPILLIHGDRDTNVPTAESIRAHDALRAAGVTTELLLLPGEGHTIVGAAGRSTLALAVVSWFRRWLVLDPPEAT